MASAECEAEVVQLGAEPGRLEQWVNEVSANRGTKHAISGVVTNSFVLAVRLVEVLQIAGLKCPGDLSVIATGDFRAFRTVWPDIAHVACDRREIGGWAADMILKKIEENGEPQPSRIYRGPVVPGKTTARPS
jgi:DNA-binding LacI/PurR family transcriptional regulator